MNEATDSLSHPDDARRSVDSCRYRRVVNRGSDAAFCELASQLMDSACGRPCAVSRAACEACVGSFEPTLSDPNPVVASLVFSAAEAWLAELDPASPLFRQVSEKRDFAVANFPRVLPHEDDLEVPTARSGDRVSLGLKDLHRRLPIATVRRGKPVRNWAVGVTTAPCRQPTIEDSVRELAGCGWTSPHLFVDGDVTLTSQLRSYRRTVRSEPAGAWLNFFLGLSELVDRHPRADAYLMAQDDARWPQAPELADYFTEFLWPPTEPLDRSGQTGRKTNFADCIVSLYTSVDDTSEVHGWERFAGRWKYGALAFIFPRSVARRMTSDPWLRKYAWSRGPEAEQLGRSGALLAGVDVALGNWAQRRKIAIWHPTPSIVQHVGNVSAIWRTSRAVGLRRASVWIGDDEER